MRNRQLMPVKVGRVTTMFLTIHHRKGRPSARHKRQPALALNDRAGGSTGRPFGPHHTEGIRRANVPHAIGPEISITRGDAVSEIGADRDKHGEPCVVDHTAPNHIPVVTSANHHRFEDGLNAGIRRKTALDEGAASRRSSPPRRTDQGRPGCLAVCYGGR